MDSHLNTEDSPLRHRRLRPRLIFAAKMIVGTSLLGLLMIRMDGQAIFSAFRRYDAITLFIATVLTFFNIAVSSFRWKVLVPEVPVGHLLRYSLIGQFYSVVLPGQVAGEAVKAWKISRGALDAPRLVASVLLDRVVGLIGLALVAVAGIALSKDVGSGNFLLPMALLAATLVAGLFVLAVPPIYDLAFRVITHTGARMPRLRTLADKALLFLAAWRAYSRSPWRLGLCLIIGVFFHLIAVGIYLLLADKIGIEIPVAHWLWIVAVTAIAVLLPLSIGGIGLREGALVVILAQFGVSGETALALSLGILGIMLLVAFVGWVADVTDRRPAGDNLNTAP